LVSGNYAGKCLETNLCVTAPNLQKKQVEFFFPNYALESVPIPLVVFLKSKNAITYKCTIMGRKYFNTYMSKYPSCRTTPYKDPLMEG
jgi:hypothetical protein